MKKTLYSAPECEIVCMGLCNQVLTGSGYGQVNEPGEVPGIDTPINF